MTKRDRIYKCNICGSVAYMLEGGDGDIACCGENMELIQEDQAKAMMQQRMPKPGSP